MYIFNNLAPIFRFFFDLFFGIVFLDFKNDFRAYHIYNDEFRATQKGQIGITMNTDWYEGFDESKENYDAAQRWMDLQVS